MNTYDEQLARLDERTKSILEKLETFDEKLFGNGQPGILALLEERIRSLENWKWWIMGGIGVIIFLLGVSIKWTSKIS